MTSHTISQSYQVKESEDITLSIIAGEEQAGWFAVFLDGKFLTHEKTKLTNYSLGKGSTIKSKTLTITTTVIDINPNTNRTSVTYFLNGGNSNLEITSEITVNHDNNPAYYDAKFKFI